MLAQSDFRSFSNQRVLLTGGSGHLGANLLRRLLADGWQVRALVQEGTNNRALDGLEIERVSGDVRDYETMVRATKDCAQVYHAAAKVSTRSPSAAEEHEIYQINTLGTRNLVQASLKTGVERFCLTGSFSGIGVDPQDPSKPVDESMPFYPFVEWLPYARTKCLAEHELLRGVAEGLDGVIAIATGIIGPNDFLPSRTGQTLIDYASNRLRGYIAGGSEFVSTDDIVEGHIRAMHLGRTGDRYLFSTSFLSIDQLLRSFEQASQKPRRARKIPAKLMLAAATLQSATYAKVFPDAPQRLTPGAIHILTMNRHASIDKARKELGYSPGNIHDAILDSYNFFVEQKMIPLS